MKIKLCVIASTLALAFAGTSAFAGGTANTFQLGQDNDARINQTLQGASNFDADIAQFGDTNSARVVQTGPGRTRQGPRNSATATAAISGKPARAMKPPT